MLCSFSKPFFNCEICYIALSSSDLFDSVFQAVDLALWLALGDDHHRGTEALQAQKNPHDLKVTHEHENGIKL
jgi:hypothetical protein